MLLARRAFTPMVIGCDHHKAAAAVVPVVDLDGQAERHQVLNDSIEGIRESISRWH